MPFRFIGWQWRRFHNIRFQYKYWPFWKYMEFMVGNSVYVYMCSLLKQQHLPESGILLMTIRAYWSKTSSCKPPVLFRTKRISHGVTANSLYLSSSPRNSYKSYSCSVCCTWKFHITPIIAFENFDDWDLRCICWHHIKCKFCYGLDLLLTMLLHSFCPSCHSLTLGLFCKQVMSRNPFSPPWIHS